MTLRNCPRPSQVARLAALGVLVAASIATAGCMKMILAVGYLVGGPPMVQPDFEKETGQSLTDKDVTVAIVVYAPTKLKWDNTNVDRDIAKYLSHRLNQHHIKVVRPDRVHAWLDKNPDWDRVEEIGEALNVTYVIHVDLEKYSLFEENAHHLYRGRAELQVTVWKMASDGTGEKVYSKERTSKFPLAIPRSTSSVAYDRFRREYLARLSEEIGRLFYEYPNGADIPDAT